MSRIAALRLRCLDPRAQEQFFVERLRMRRRPDGSIGYDESEAGLLFELAETPRSPSRRDLYWKIGIAVPDLDLACEQLRGDGVDVSDPHQFEDVGYLAHLDDPGGFTIELIAHEFAGTRSVGGLDAGALGGGPHLNLVTLRTTDIERDGTLCESLGMTRLSIQELASRGFTLHFYAFTGESPPNPDLRSVENRPWLYQRPYTLLELQHLREPGELRIPGDGEAGYAGIVLDVGSDSIRPNALGLTRRRSPVDPGTRRLRPDGDSLET